MRSWSLDAKFLPIFLFQFMKIQEDEIFTFPKDFQKIEFFLFDMNMHLHTLYEKYNLKKNQKHKTQYSHLLFSK